MNAPKKSDLLIAAHALGPWEGPQPLPFAIEALTQLSAELRVLRAALCDADASQGPLDNELVSRAITGLAERADAAAMVAGRLTTREAAAQREGSAQ